MPKIKNKIYIYFFLLCSFFLIKTTYDYFKAIEEMKLASTKIINTFTESSRRDDDIAKIIRIFKTTSYDVISTTSINKIGLLSNREIRLGEFATYQPNIKNKTYSPIYLTSIHHRTPIIADQSCLKCHATYKEGEWVGVLDISEPLSFLNYIIFSSCFILLILIVHRITYKKNKRCSLSKLIKRDYFKEHKINKTDCVIALIDIDNFKLVNDTFGHSIGDKVITHVSKCILSAIRYKDVAFRWGGEEFLILLESDSCPYILEKIRNDVESLHLKGLPKVTISTGYKTYSPDLSFSENIAQSDLALYHAKDNGKNMIIEYNSERRC